MNHNFGGEDNGNEAKQEERGAEKRCVVRVTYDTSHFFYLFGNRFDPCNHNKKEIIKKKMK